jgi:hypothetical protein
MNTTFFSNLTDWGREGSTGTVLCVSVLSLLGTLSTGCSEAPSSSPPSETKDAAVDVPVDPNVAKVCPGACETVRTCVAETDVNACEAQCAKELAGNGYLIPYVALPMFVALRDTKPDYACFNMSGGHIWEELQWSVTEDKDQFEECRAAMIRFYGGDDNEGFSHYCYEVFYILNQPIRDTMRPCFDSSVPMDEIRKCIESHYPTKPSTTPWIAGVPRSDSGIPWQ